MCKKELLDKAFTEAVTEEEILEELKKTTDVDYVLNTFTNQFLS